ncbi:MAG: hypothetical protein AB1758_09545 [Candidatus Eremiobacterota bacterium]
MRIFGDRSELGHASRRRQQRARWAEDLQARGVEFRHTRSRLFRDSVTETVGPDQAAADLNWWSRNRLEARRPGEAWLRVDRKEDLGELAAFSGLAAPDGLDQPDLARMLAELSRRGAVFTASQHHQPAVVGAYGAYNVLTGDPKGLNGLQVALDGESFWINTRSDATLLGYITGSHPRPEGADPVADSYRFLQQAGVRPVGQNWLQFDKHRHGFREVSLRVGDHVLLHQADPTALNDPARLQADVQPRLDLLGRLTATAGPEEAQRTWMDLRLYQPDGYPDTARLVSQLLDHGCTRPAAPGRWALAAGPEALSKLASTGEPHLLAAACQLLETRQRGIPKWREVERLAGRLKQAGLKTSELENLADCARAAAPWRLESDPEQVSMVSREIGLSGLSQPRVTFLSRSQMNLEVSAEDGQWRPLELRSEELDHGWRYNSGDLAPLEGKAVRLRFSLPLDAEPAEVRNLKVRGQDTERGPGLIRRAIEFIAKAPPNWGDPDALFLADLLGDMSWGYGKGRRENSPVQLQDSIPVELKPNLKERLLVLAANQAMQTLVPDKVVFRSQEGEQTARNLLRLAVDPAIQPGQREENFAYLGTLPAPAMLAALAKRHHELERLRRQVPMTAVLFEDSQSLAERVQEAAEDPGGPQIQVRGDSVVFGGVRVKRKKPIAGVP